MMLSSLDTAEVTQEPWWKRAGFRWHPFEQLDAAQEEHLPEYFIEPPRFWEVSGRAHTVLYAPLGGGKTAARRMLEQQCLAGEIEGTLVVVCDDFARVLRQAEGDPRDVTAEMLIEEIMHQAADIVFEHWMENIESFQETTAFHQRWVACFLGDWEVRCDEALHKLGLGEVVSVQQIQQESPEVLRSQVGEDYWPWVRMLSTLSPLRREPPEERTAGEWLERLGGVTRQLGFETIYVLFDRVDGLSQTAGPEGCTALIQPLLHSTVLLSVPDVYFKLFLPLETRSLLGEMAGIRSQRVVEVEAKWDEEKLGELLKRRLQSASEKRIEALGVISEEEIKGKVDDKLIHYAQTPRHLIRLGQRLFAEHERLSPERLYLTGQDLDAALAQERAREARGKSFQRREHGYRLGQLISTISIPVLILLALLIWQSQGPVVVFLSIAAVPAISLAVYLFIFFCLLLDKERRAHQEVWTKEHIWELRFRLVAFFFLLLFLSLLVLTWLPSVIPCEHTPTYALSSTSGAIFCTHPRWSALGDIGAIGVTALGIKSPLTATLLFSPLDAVEWPEGNAIYWQTGGSTQTRPVRFIRSGWLYYAIEIQTEQFSESGGSGWIYILPLPAPLMSQTFSLTGLALSAVVTAFAGKLAQWFSRLIP